MRKTVSPLPRLSAATLIIAFTAVVNAEDAVADNVDTPYINADSVDAGMVDTVNVDTRYVSADSVDAINVDTNNIAAKNADTAVLTVNPAMPNIKPNDEPPRLSGACWGFGMGLSVGDAPIFPMWQKRFPDSMDSLGLSPAFGADSGDAGPLRYRVTESPDAFNFALPFRLSLYSIGETRVFSFAVSFFRNSKRFQTELSISSDTVARRFGMIETLVFHSVSLEAAGGFAIPPAFFSIDGTQQTLLTLAVGASPVNAFTRSCEFEQNFDAGDARLSAAADSVKKAFAALSGNGLSLSWRVGISAIKRYSSGSGVEFGLFYSGAYRGYFYSDGVRLTEEHIKKRGTDLNAESVAGGKPLAFLSNQAEFTATFLLPAKSKSLTSDSFKDN
jgi:hypothetical protein